MTKLKNIHSSSGTTMVNAKFNFANQRLLSSMASSDKTEKSKTKTVSKIVDRKADAARVSVAKSVTSLSSTAIATIKSPEKIPGLIPLDVQEKLVIIDGGSRLSPSVAKLPIPPSLKPILPPGSLPSSPTTATPPAVESSATTVSAEGVPPPILEESPGRISVFSAVTEAEKLIFKPGSSLSSALSGDEKFSGKRLTENEKPKLLAVVEEGIKDGYPKSNAILFRKLKTNRGYATKYTIFRKDLFREFLFKKLAVLDPSTLIVPNQYKDLVVELEEQESDVFVIRDLLIRKDAVYAYKIEVEWASTAVRPETEFLATDAAQDLSILTDARRRIQEALAGIAPASAPTTPPPSTTPTDSARTDVLTGVARRI